MAGKRTVAEAEAAWAAHLATYVTIPATDRQAWMAAFAHAEALAGRLAQAHLDAAFARWHAEQQQGMQACPEGAAILRLYRQYQAAMLGEGQAPRAS